MSKRPKGFQCKQFFIAHEQCAMKVGTDSLLLGSWVSLPQDTTSQRYLDIGTGSGLLAIMLAQRTVIQGSALAPVIDAIELDPNAAAQACDNAEHSPWQARLSIIQGDILSEPLNGPYRLIITNPPYFAHAEGDTRAFDKQSALRQQARQTTTLTLGALFARVKSLLDHEGEFACVLPFDRLDEAETLASRNGLFLSRCLLVHSKPNVSPYLCALQFRQQTTIVNKRALIIRDEKGAYTKDYQQLCKDFYLNF